MLRIPSWTNQSFMECHVKDFVDVAEMIIVQAKGCVTSLLFVKKQGTSSVEKCAFRRGVLNNALLQTNDGPPSYPQHK